MAVRVRGNYFYLDFRCHLPDGRKVRCVESTGLKVNQGNKKIAEAKDKAIRYELKHGRFNYLHFFQNGSKAKYFNKPAADVTLNEWWTQFMEEKTLRRTTHQNQQSIYRKRIEPALGNVPIASIDETSLLVFRKRLLSEGFSAVYANYLVKLVCSSLAKAQRRGMIPENPCRDITRLKEEIPDINPFSFEEVRHWLDFLAGKNSAWHDMMVLWVHTGLRPGELCALRWEHVDFFNRKLLVRATRTNAGIETPPKTPHSVRDVDMRPPVVEALKRQQSRTGLQNEHIFLNQARNPWTPTMLQFRFAHYLRLAKLRYRTQRQMRHTFATLAIAAGENISWVSKMLGHSDAKVTLVRYNRYVPNLTRDDGSALEKALGAGVQNGNNLVTMRNT